MLFFDLKNDNLSFKKAIHYICRMSIFRRFFDFYIFSNIHVAIAAFSLAKITLIENQIYGNMIPVFVFFSTIISYNFIRFYKSSKIQHWLPLFISNNKNKLIGLTIISLLVVIYLSFSLNFKAIITLVPFVLLTLFYIVPFPWKKNKSVALRSIALLKLFLIATTYAGVTVLFPLMNYDVKIQNAEFITFIQRFLFIVAITIPFDIRDLSFDDSNLKTLPQVVGIRRSKVIGLIILMLFLGSEFFKNMTASSIRICFIIALLSLFLLLKSSPRQSKYYSAFFVESIPIIWLILLFIT